MVRKERDLLQPDRGGTAGGGGGGGDESLFGTGDGGGRECDPVRMNLRRSITNQEQKGHRKSLAVS